MGISCKPIGIIKSRFDKLDYATKKEEELNKKLSKKVSKKEVKDDRR